MTTNKGQGAIWVVALILITGCIFFGAMFHAELQALLASLVFSLIYAAQGRRAKEGAPMLLVTLLVLQNLAIGIGAHVGGNESSSMSYLTQIPFVTCAVLFCSVAAERLDKPMLDGLNRWFWALVAWCGVMFFVGHGASLPAQLVTLRNLICWFMAFCVARAFLDSQELRDRFYQQFGWICVAVALLGFFGMAISWQGWLDMGLREVYIAKQSPLESLADWNGRFTTSIDGSHNVLRMLSTYYEPVNLAYLFSAGFVCIAAAWRRGAAKAFALCIVTVGLIWSFGKGGWVVTAAACAFLALSSGMRKRGCTQRDLGKLLVALVAVIAVVLTAYYFLIGGAVRPHFWAIERTLGNVLSTPFGHGLGTGGNAAAFFGGSDDGWLSSGGESALMSFAYQVGIPGVLCLFFALFAVAKTSLSKERTAKGALLFSLPFILLGVSLLQDNTFSPQCVVPFMVLLGAFSAEGRGDASAGISAQGCLGLSADE